MTDAHAPAQEEEPQSPPWLPALGLAFFAAVAIAWSLCSTPAAPGEQGAGSAAPSPSGAPAH